MFRLTPYTSVQQKAGSDPVAPAPQTHPPQASPEREGSQETGTL